VRKIPKGIKSNYKNTNYIVRAGSIISESTMNIKYLTDLIIENGVVINDFEIEGNWRYSSEKMWEYGVNKELYITRDLYIRRIVNTPRIKYMKDLLLRVGDNNGLSTNANVNHNNLFENGWGSNEDADNELINLFGTERVFAYPKPTKLLKKLIVSFYNKSSTILDFFAGSGTTGHAVMELNKEDGGNRKFILCTNNENNICREVTFERIKRVIERESYEASLKYFVVDFVKIDKLLYYEYAETLLKHIKELVELENAIDFGNNPNFKIILLENELEEFISNLDESKTHCKLYLSHKLLLSRSQNDILDKHHISQILIPEYYYKELQRQ
jgi:hypothetical protein